MKQYKDIHDMTRDELEEYLDDVSTGYAYDPDNEILEGDKNLSFKEFFEKMNAEVQASQFKSVQEFAESVSRGMRMCEWVHWQMCALSDNMSLAFKNLVQEQMNKNSD